MPFFERISAPVLSRGLVQQEGNGELYNQEPVTNQVADITGHLFKQLSGIVNNINGWKISRVMSARLVAYELNDELLPTDSGSPLDPMVSSATSRLSSMRRRKPTKR